MKPDGNVCISDLSSIAHAYCIFHLHKNIPCILFLFFLLYLLISALIFLLTCKSIVTFSIRTHNSQRRSFFSYTSADTAKKVLGCGQITLLYVEGVMKELPVYGILLGALKTAYSETHMRRMRTFAL